MIFDNLDARFGLSSSHHLAPETYFELRHIGGHTEKNATILLEDVLSTYNKLELVLKYTTPRKALATAIALICRGKHQCPMGMRKYFKIAGGPTKVAEAGGIIGIRLRYDPEERIKSWASKMQRSLSVGEDFVQKIDGLAQMIDLMPTLLDVLNIKSDAKIEGKSLMPLVLRNETVNDFVFAATKFKPVGENLFFKNPTLVISAQNKEWKLIKEIVYYDNETLKSVNYELYNLKKDPEEISNVFDNNKETTQKFDDVISRQFKV